MARTRTNVAIDDVLKALRVNGETGTPAAKFIELVHMVEKLGPKEQIVRARDIRSEHIGLQVTTKSGRIGFITDVESVPQSGPGNLRTAYHRIHQSDLYESDTSFSDDEPGIAPAQSVMIIIDGKINRLHRNQLLTLTETRDI